MIGLILFTMCVLCSEKVFVKSDNDKLDFWVRDPEMDGFRRNLLDSGKQNFHYIKFAKQKNNRHFHLNTTNTTESSHINHTARHFPTIGPQNTFKHKKALRTGIDNNLWPRVHKKHRKNYALRSTRMTVPDMMPLVQNSEEKAQVHEEEDETLRSYIATNVTVAELCKHKQAIHLKEIRITETCKIIDKHCKCLVRHYLTLQLKEQLEKFSQTCSDANITVEVLDRTMEYNDIVLMKITEKKSDFERHFRADDNKYADDVPEKKIVFIVHALSVMGLKDDSCLKNITQFKKLLSYYFVHLDKFDIFLIPMANPDGFMQTFVNVYANKNMSPQSACSGVALDRNFDVAWNDSTSISSCSPQYPGPRPFSEPESRAIRDVLHRYSHKLLAYIHVHAGSYNHEIFKGHAVLYPKGYTDVQSDDDKYIDLRGEIDEAMKNASFHVMSVAVDTLYNWYGKVSGTSVDYASTIYGIPYALEFVMQPYETIYLETAALEQIWKRIIDVTFNNIFRSMENFEFK